jgi:class 3 adenylate cyclase
MCAGGLPLPSSSHPINVVLAAIEIQQFLRDWKLQKIDRGEPYFEARLGIHTGPIVAGVVGVKKFAYDIWGDTVNVAARMESTCEAGKINISESTHQLIKGKFMCSYRGKVPAKGMGEIDMYYVDMPVSVEEPAMAEG